VSVPRAVATGLTPKLMAQTSAHTHRVSVPRAVATGLTPELWPKSLSVLARRNKRLDHLGADEIAIELIQLRQPEIVTRIVCVRPGVGIAAQISEELHQDKRAIEFLAI